MTQRIDITFWDTQNVFGGPNITLPKLLRLSSSRPDCTMRELTELAGDQLIATVNDETIDTFPDNLRGTDHYLVSQGRLHRTRSTVAPAKNP